ncbi:hypothetical protein HYALB_00002992 [Hymenoscyphus albidus]|uniref:Cytochrome P450 n=1 Tax=Hymenoscyphus albidus TaxID=595503 RepID=A0A9N9M6K9_9HELO|nr:hypothetical protein HYALB_00002992 [Hymenoscyphus albidus]
METEAQFGSIQSAFLAYSQIHIVYKLGHLILLVWLIRKAISKPNQDKLFPVWATIEIAVAGYVFGGGNNGSLGQRLYSTIRRYRGSLYGVSPAHQVLTNVSNVERFMAQGSHTLNTEPIQYTLFTRVFGGEPGPDLKRKLELTWKDLLAPLERMFLNEATTSAALENAGISQKATSFVTFSQDSKHMKRWELSADIQIITPDSPGKPGIVEANFQSLVRDFGACIAIPLLYGKDFMNRYPQLLDDFWKFDNDMFPLLMIGIPPWAPMKKMREGRIARERLTCEIEALYRRIDQYQKGQPVDFDADISDVGSAALERSMAYDKENWSFRQRGGGDLAALWGQNANTQAVLFWFLAYIYSTPGLVDEVRKEIAPYVILSDNSQQEITSMDLTALCRQCQLMKSCLFETYRMVNEATSIRMVARPITLTDGDHEHQLQPGMFVSAPHVITQRDPSIYPDPDRFIPDRFLVVDAESGKSGAKYGKLKPWGSGAGMCKGRTFAEKEILSLGACIISLWDISPASGTWKLPSMMPGTGVRRPVEDIRVRITRRPN